MLNVKIFNIIIQSFHKTVNYKKNSFSYQMQSSKLKVSFVIFDNQIKLFYEIIPRYFNLIRFSEV